MLVAFFIWRKLFQTEFKNKWDALLALFSFTSSYYLTYYAAELKQYSMDVLVVALFCLYMLSQQRYAEKAPSRKFVAATILLPFTLVLSYTGFFIFWMALCNFILIVRRNNKIIPAFLIYMLLCLGAIFFTFYFDITYDLKEASIFNYWQDYFLRTDSFYGFLKSFGEGLRRLTVWWFGDSRIFRKVASCFIPLFVFFIFKCGLSSLKMNKLRFRDVEAIGFSLFAVLFTLGLIKKYPFTGERITLFFAPFVFYYIIRGINFFKKNKVLYLCFNIFYIAFLAACSFNSFFNYLGFYR